MLEYVPWKSRAWTVDKDPRQFRFAIVCNYCKISRNSLGSMRKHLQSCPERKCPDLTCGHCAKRFDKWSVLAAHLNVPGMDIEKACRPCFKLPHVVSPSFPNFQSRMRKHALRAAGKGTTVPKTKIQYNSWQNVHPSDMKAVRREAAKLRARTACGPVVVSPVRGLCRTSPGSVSLHTAQVDSFSDVEPDDPSLSSVQTSSSLLPRRSSTVTSITASSALPSVTPRPTLFEALAMVPSATKHVKRLVTPLNNRRYINYFIYLSIYVQSSIPQANLLVPDVLPLPTFQDYLSDWADETADSGRPCNFFLQPVEPLGQPILSLDQGLATPVVDAKATQSLEEVILPSLSREELDLVLVRDPPQVELPGVVAPVLHPGSVTSTVPDETVGHESELLNAPRVPLQETRISSSDGEGDEPVRMLTNTEIQIKNEGGDIIIISSPETDDRQSASSDIIALRRELLTLRRQSRSHLRQLAFWADTVAKLGGELERAPSESEIKLREKMVACGDWPPHMATSIDMGHKELGYRFADMYRAMLLCWLNFVTRSSR